PENNGRHATGEADGLGETNNGGATNEQHGGVRALSQRPVTVGEAFRRQHSESDRLLRAGDRARPELCAGLRRSGPSLYPTPFLHRGGPVRRLRKGERRGTESSPP